MPDKKQNKSLSIIFPAYNEQDNIEDTLQKAYHYAEKRYKSFEIIVVNDGSADKTAQIVLDFAKKFKRVNLINHKKNQGYGSAVWDGLKAAKHELVFFADSDQQFDIDELDKLTDKIDQYDVVIGYRAKRQDRFLRKVNAFGWKVLLRILLGLKVRDIDCAFKLFRREVIQKISVRSMGATFSAELIYNILDAGYSIHEIPVGHYPRKLGSPTGAKLSVITRAFKELIAFNKNRKKKTSGLFFKVAGVILLAWSLFWLSFNTVNFSVTSDEIVHLPVGIRYVQKGDLMMNNEHPPIFKLLSGVSANLLKPNLETAINTTSEQWRFGFTFFFKSDNNFKQVLEFGRLPSIIITMILLVSVWVWMSRKLGNWAGLGALGVLAFNPSLLSHGVLVTNDVYLATAAWLLFIATYNFIIKCNNPQAIWWGLALTFAALSKYTGFLLVLISILVVAGFLVFSDKKRLNRIKLILIGFAVAIVACWSIYIFCGRTIVFSGHTYTVHLPKISSFEIQKPVNKVVLFPLQEVYDGLMADINHNKIGHRSYLNGNISDSGSKTYFLNALYYKTPTIVLLIIGIGIILGIYRRNLIVISSTASALIYFLMGSFGDIQIGVRHIIIIYVLLAPAAGFGIQEIIKLKNIWIKVLLFLAFVYLLVDLAIGGPAKISYFSLISGSSKNGYQHLADSNIDWGQEFYLFEKHVLEKQPKNLIAGISSGEEPQDVGITSQSLKQFSCGDFPDDSTIIASVNYIVGLFGPYECLREEVLFGKAKRLGHTYYIFNSRDLSN